jgi:predicted ATP-dependent serine protease
MNGAAQWFRCLECGAFWPMHYSVCASCFCAGYIIPWAPRPRAVVDSIPGASNARELARMAFSSIEQEAYPKLRLGAGALVDVSGGPGAGKSSWACRLVDAVRGPALLVSAEEGLSPSLAARLLRCNVKRQDFHVVTRASVDAAVAYARKVGAVAAIVDSVQEAAWSAHELRHVLEVCKDLRLLVAVLQQTKTGAPAGANALVHECDVHVIVESMKWVVQKSRYQDVGIGGDVLPSTKESAA